jgi:hypothetical protein
MTPGTMGSREVPVQPMDIRIGDVYTLRKPHPCGSYDWRVVRVGADIGMKCAKCDHKVLLPRSEFERRVKKLVSREGGEDQEGHQP